MGHRGVDRNRVRGTLSSLLRVVLYFIIRKLIECVIAIFHNCDVEQEESVS